MVIERIRFIAVTTTERIILDVRATKLQQVLETDIFS